jgi:predicted ATPase
VKQQIFNNRWLNDLKLAVVNEDLNSLIKLNSSLPKEFKSNEELQEALALTKEALEFVSKAKNELSKEMSKLKKISNYL